MQIMKKILKFSAYLLEEQVNLASLFVIKVDGKSMQPLIKDRSLVVAKAVLSFNTL
jgi:phage repressor protein C with HTH and peptisase S24 domain